MTNISSQDHLSGHDPTHATNKTDEIITNPQSNVHVEEDKKISGIFSRCLGDIKAFFTKVDKNSECQNHELQIRHSLAKTSHVFKEVIKNLTENLKHKAKSLKEGRVIRSLKEMLHNLTSVDFSFERASEEAKEKELYDEEQVALSSKALIDPLLSEGEQLEQVKMCMKAIGQVRFGAKQAHYRNAMVAELLSKELAAMNVPENYRLEIPCYTKKGEAVCVPYVLEKRFSMGESGIPVLFFVPEKYNGEEFSPIILFRGTRVNFNKAEDVLSIIENLNVCGPARGLYCDFNKQLKDLFENWFKTETHHTPFRIFGYSQGGVLGQRAMADFYKYMSLDVNNPSLFFNSPGVEKDYVEEWLALGDKERPAAIHYVITHDIISKSGREFLGEVYEIKPEKSSIMNAHFGKRFFEKAWELFEIDKSRESLSPSRGLINQIMASHTVGTLYQIAKKGLDKVLKPRIIKAEKLEPHPAKVHLN